MADFEDANYAHLGQSDRGPDQPPRRGAPTRSPSTSPERQALRAERQDRYAAGAAARLAPAREACPGRRRADVGLAVRFRPVSSSTTRRSCWRGAPVRISICRSSRAISKRGCGTTSSFTRSTTLGLPKGTIQCDGADRDDPGRLRDGRDPLRAARSFRRSQLRPLGLHLSFIKKFAQRPGLRAARPRSGHDVPRTSCAPTSRLLIKTCHRRDVHAMGGMAAQIPIHNDPAANEAAMEKVRADKQREAGDGHDGTWVAHPGLVAIAKEIFDRDDAAAQPDRAASARTCTSPPPIFSQARGHDHRGGSARRTQCRHAAISKPGCAARLRAALQSDGRRRHRRDQPRPDLAVDPPARQARRRPHVYACALPRDARRGALLAGDVAVEGALPTRQSLPPAVLIAYSRILTLPAYDLIG